MAEKIGIFSGRDNRKALWDKQMKAIWGRVPGLTGTGNTIELYSDQPCAHPELFACNKSGSGSYGVQAPAPNPA